MRPGITLYGGFEGDPGTEGDFTTRDPVRFISELNGAGEDQLLLAAGDCTVDGFLLRNAAATYGGAIYFDNSGKALDTLNVANCHFVNCETPGTSNAGGGAIAVFDGILDVSNSTFLFCRSYRGGAIFLQESSAHIDGCVFSSNNALNNSGGAIASVEFTSADAFLRCSKTHFIGNRAGQNLSGGAGGAVSIYWRIGARIGLLYLLQ